MWSTLPPLLPSKKCTDALLQSLTPPALAFQLLSASGLASSSGADDALFARTLGGLERLWSGVLGCADGNEPLTVRNRFNDSGSLQDTSDEAVPTGGGSDYFGHP